MTEESSFKKIIGLTGPLGGGKGTVADYLKEQGFFYCSCSDVIREELDKLNLEHTRENLQKMGVELREKYGHEILAKRLWEKIKKRPEQKIVVDSIRNPGEIEEFKKRSRFVLLGVEAPIELRYERIKSRQRASDFVSFEKFKKQEEFEMTTTGPGQQLGVCLKKADYKIMNDGTIDHLRKKVQNLMTKIGFLAG